MKCIYMKIRSKQYHKYIYCQQNKKEISFNDCKICNLKQYKEIMQIKKKSNKLAKLERQRDRNIIKSGICEACLQYKKRLDPHEVYGGSNRQRSIKNKFVKLICRECHSNEKIINELRIKTQKEYEKNHTREQFIALIGKSYLNN